MVCHVKFSALQARAFTDVFEIGVLPDAEAVEEQELFVLPQHPVFGSAGISIHVLIAPRQLVALLILAKHAHLLNIEVRVKSELAERQRQQSTLRRLFGSSRGGSSEQSRAASAALPQVSRVEDINFLQAAQVAGNSELGDTQAVRESVARCARLWRAFVAERKLAAVEMNPLLGDSPAVRRAVARCSKRWRAHTRKRTVAAASAASVWKGKAGLKSVLKRSERVKSATTATTSARRLWSAGTSGESAGWVLPPAPADPFKQMDAPAHGASGITGRRNIHLSDCDDESIANTDVAPSALARSLSGRARRRCTQPRSGEAVTEGTEKKVGAWSAGVYSTTRRAQNAAARSSAAQPGSSAAASPPAADTHAQQGDAQNAEETNAAAEDEHTQLHSSQQLAGQVEAEVLTETPLLDVVPRVSRSDLPLVAGSGEAQQQADASGHISEPVATPSHASSAKIDTLRQRVLGALGEDEDLLATSSDGSQSAQPAAEQPAATAAPGDIAALPAHTVAVLDTSLSADAVAADALQAWAAPAGPSQWQRVRAHVGFESRDSGSDDGKQLKQHTSDAQAVHVAQLPAQSTSLVAQSARKRLGFDGDARPSSSHSFKALSKRLSGLGLSSASFLLSKMRDVVAAAQTDPVVLAQNQFLVLLAQVRLLLIHGTDDCFFKFSIGSMSLST